MEAETETDTETMLQIEWRHDQDGKLTLLEVFRITQNGRDKLLASSVNVSAKARNVPLVTATVTWASEESPISGVLGFLEGYLEAYGATHAWTVVAVMVPAAVALELPGLPTGTSYITPTRTLPLTPVEEDAESEAETRWWDVDWKNACKSPRLRMAVAAAALVALAVFMPLRK